MILSLFAHFVHIFAPFYLQKCPKFDILCASLFRSQNRFRLVLWSENQSSSGEAILLLTFEEYFFTFLAQARRICADMNSCFDPNFAESLQPNFSSFYIS